MRVVSAVVIAVAACVGVLSADVVDQVAAEVNGKRIMLSEVRQEVADRLADLPAGLPPLERRRQADVIIKTRLLHMIRETMLLQAADRELTDAHKAAVNRRVDEEMADIERKAGGRDALQRDLESKGSALAELRDDLHRRVTVQTYVASKTRPGAHVTRKKLLDYYRSHPQEFSRPERRSFRIIQIRVDRFATRAQALANAREARKRIAQGETFADLVKVFSHGLHDDEGGFWPPMAQGDFAVEAVDRALFALDAGQVSDVIETPKALYLVRVEGIEPAVDLSFEDAQADIRTRLMDEILQKRRLELAIELEKKSHLKVHYR